MLPWPYVCQIVHVEEIDSTNDLARRMIEAGSLDVPALIWADVQTRGRGQRSNLWWSDGGSLTFSLVIDPASVGLTVEQEARVALVAASLVIDAIVELVPACSPAIRWPNDIEVNGRKLGGILPERVLCREGSRLVIGIGLNVQTRLDEAPEAVSKMAASLVEWSPGVSKVELLQAILGRFPATLRRLSTNDPALTQRWRELDALLGSFLRVEVGSEIIEGTALGIDDQGALRIDRAGRPFVLHAGRVLR